MDNKMGKRIKELRQSKGLTQQELGDVIGVNRSAIMKYEKGMVENIKRTSIQKLSEFFGVEPTYLMGLDTSDTSPIESNIGTIYDKKIYKIPVYKSVSAGFGAYADNYIVDYEPLYIESSSEAAETICIIVEGDSMYPKIEDGDIIQVQRVTSVDSGSIAVVLIDDNESVVKKVVYGDDWIELHSINPMYKTMRFEGPDVQRLRVLGLVRRILKNV